MRDKRYLSWAEFDRCIDQMGVTFFHALKAKEKGTNACGIYGEPRGGLPIAVALSHLLKLPVLTDMPANAQVIWVDDIFDSNATWGVAEACARSIGTDLFAMAWFSRGLPPPGTWSMEHLETDIWLVFPWEKWGDADEDM